MSEQDRLDGEALRRLGEAHPGTWELSNVMTGLPSRTVGYVIHAWLHTEQVLGDPDSMGDVYPTIAEAADAARAALEAA